MSRFTAYKTSTVQDISTLMSLVRVFLIATTTENGMRFQSYQINGTRILRRDTPAPKNLTDCACSVALRCPDRQWSGGQFICKHGNNCTKGTVVWSIPGLVTSCTTFETFFDSDLRCFFDRACFDTLLSMFNVDMPDRLPLPAATIAIPVMNSSIPSLFSPNDTIGSILDRLTIEEWRVTTNYEGYYKTCAPDTCKYSVLQRADPFYTASLIISIFGGLIVTFRLLVPVAVRLVHWIVTYRRARDTHTHDSPSGKLVANVHLLCHTEM